MQKLAKKFDVLPWVVGGITFLILSLFTMPFFRDKTSYFDPNGLIIGEGGGGFFSPGIAGLSDIVSSENKDLLDAVRFANAAAVLSTRKVGAQPSIPTRKEVEK